MRTPVPELYIQKLEGIYEIFNKSITLKNINELLFLMNNRSITGFPLEEAQLNYSLALRINIHQDEVDCFKGLQTALLIKAFHHLNQLASSEYIAQKIQLLEQVIPHASTEFFDIYLTFAKLKITQVSPEFMSKTMQHKILAYLVSLPNLSRIDQLKSNGKLILFFLDLFLESTFITELPNHKASFDPTDERISTLLDAFSEEQIKSVRSYLQQFKFSHAKEIFSVHALSKTLNQQDYPSFRSSIYTTQSVCISLYQSEYQPTSHHFSEHLLFALQTLNAEEDGIFDIVASVYTNFNEAQRILEIFFHQTAWILKQKPSESLLLNETYYPVAIKQDSKYEEIEKKIRSGDWPNALILIKTIKQTDLESYLILLQNLTTLTQAEKILFCIRPLIYLYEKLQKPSKKNIKGYFLACSQIIKIGLSFPAQDSDHDKNINISYGLNSVVKDFILLFLLPLFNENTSLIRNDSLMGSFYSKILFIVSITQIQEALCLGENLAEEVFKNINILTYSENRSPFFFHFSYEDSYKEILEEQVPYQRVVEEVITLFQKACYNPHAAVTILNNDIKSLQTKKSIDQSYEAIHSKNSEKKFRSIHSSCKMWVEEIKQEEIEKAARVIAEKEKEMAAKLRKEQEKNKPKPEKIAQEKQPVLIPKTQEVAPPAVKIQLLKVEKPIAIKNEIQEKPKETQKIGISSVPNIASQENIRQSVPSEITVAEKITSPSKKLKQKLRKSRLPSIVEKNSEESIKQTKIEPIELITIENIPEKPKKMDGYSKEDTISKADTANQVVSQINPLDTCQNYQEREQKFIKENMDACNTGFHSAFNPGELMALEAENQHLYQNNRQLHQEIQQFLNPNHQPSLLPPRPSQPFILETKDMIINISDAEFIHLLKEEKIKSFNTGFAMGNTLLHYLKSQNQYLRDENSLLFRIRFQPPPPPPPPVFFQPVIVQPIFLVPVPVPVRPVYYNNTAPLPDLSIWSEARGNKPLPLTFQPIRK